MILGSPSSKERLADPDVSLCSSLFEVLLLMQEQIQYHRRVRKVMLHCNMFLPYYLGCAISLYCCRNTFFEKYLHPVTILASRSPYMASDRQPEWFVSGYLDFGNISLYLIVSLKHFT